MSDEPKLKVVEPTTVLDDPYDLEKLRVSQDFLETTSVKKLLTTVPLRKPLPQDFVRVHPDPKYRDVMALLELKEEREIYAANLNLVPDLQSEVWVGTVFTAITRTNVLFLWPVRVPSADGRVLDWHKSAAEAAEQAMKGWVRVRANMGLRAYDIFLAEAKIPEPEWPTLTFQQIVRIAFKDRIINRDDHPVIKRLRGG
jgi:hypothetical protein